MSLSVHTNRFIWARELKNPYWWPGKLQYNSEIDPNSDILDRRKPGTSLVYLFGVNKSEWIRDENIKEYTSDLKQDLPRNLQGEYFKLAVKEIEKLMLEEKIRQSEVEMELMEEQDGAEESEKQRLHREVKERLYIRQMNQIPYRQPQHQHYQQRDKYRDRHHHQHHLSNEEEIGSDEIIEHQQSQHRDEYQDSYEMSICEDEDEVNSDPSGKHQEVHKLSSSIESNQDMEDDNDNHLSRVKRTRDDIRNEEMEEQEGSSPTHHNNKSNQDSLNEDHQNIQLKKKKVTIESGSGSDDVEYEEIDDNNNSPQNTNNNNNNGNNNSPQLNSKRSLLIKPPRSPITPNQPTNSNNNQNGNISTSPMKSKPVLIGATLNNNSSPSITCISKPPITSPQIRSAISNLNPTNTSQAPNAPIISICSNSQRVAVNSPPILPSKIPPNVVNALLQKNRIQPSASNHPKSSPSIGGQSPSLYPKVPITLSIPRIAKKAPNSPIPNGGGSTSSGGGHVSSPAIVSVSANGQSGQPTQSPLQMGSAPSQFQLPQQFRKSNPVFPHSPSNMVQRSPVHMPSRYPQSPQVMMSMGMGHPSMSMTPPLQAINNHHIDHRDIEAEEITNSTPSTNNAHNNQQQQKQPIPPNGPHHINNGTPILTQPFPLMPFMPPFSLNSAVNMETTFNSPFSGKLSVKGSFDYGFHIECSIMGKTFQGYLTDSSPLPSNFHPKQTQQPIPHGYGIMPPMPVMPPNQLRSNEAITPEAYKQWQEMVIKSQIQKISQSTPQQSSSSAPHHSSPSSNNTQTNNSNNHSNNNSTTASTNDHVNNSNNSTPVQPSKSSSNSSSGHDSNSPNTASSSNNTNCNNIEESEHIILDDNESKQPTSQQLPPPQQPSSEEKDNIDPEKLYLMASSSSSQLANNQQFLKFKYNAFQKVEHYQKVQILQLLGKQEESAVQLLEMFEKEKQQTDNDHEKIIQLKSKLKEEQEKLRTTHNEQRAKLDSTHNHQAQKFHREVEKQWNLLQMKQNGQVSNNRAPLSPMGSPNLTPFISPSPAPSPSLSSFLGGGSNSPQITPVTLIKGGINPFSLNQIPSNQNHNNQTGNNQNNSNNNLNNNDNQNIKQEKDKDDESQPPPPLSLSSNSPPRSPNEEGKETGARKDIKKTILLQKENLKIEDEVMEEGEEVDENSKHIPHHQSSGSSSNNNSNSNNTKILIESK